MGLRHGLLASFSLIALAASAQAQTSPGYSRDARSSEHQCVRVGSHRAAQPPARIGSAARRRMPRVRWLEALAATYSNQPALQAERAKLRATDENVPTALAGWRPTVVLAGTAGYGDGVVRRTTT